MRALSREKDAKERESNLKSSLRVLSLSRIFEFNGLFCVDTGRSWVLAILTIKSAAFQEGGVKCCKSAVDKVAVEVCPSSTPIL